MKKVGQFIEEMNEKVAFVASPQHGQLQQMEQEIQGMLQNLPPQIAQQAAGYLEQINDLPPDQYAEALQGLGDQISQMMQQMGGQQGPQGQPQDPNAPQQDPNAQPPQGQQGPPPQQDPNAQPQQGPPPQGGGAPTNLDQTMITMTARELLDLVSGGKATQSHTKVQSIINQSAMRDQQAAAKAQQQAQAQQQTQAQQQGTIYPPGQ